VRSRTRNGYFLLAACQLISTLMLNADDYLIGYRASSHNSRLTHENLSISKSMTPCTGNHHKSLTLPRNPNDSLKSTLTTHEEEFFDFVTQQTLHLKSNQNIQIQKHTSIDTLTVPTQCYAVDFNEDFVTIILLK
jgi:hypothetical protein